MAYAASTRHLYEIHTAPQPPMVRQIMAGDTADGPITCSIQCLDGNCDRHMVDVRLDTLPQHLPGDAVVASYVSNVVSQALCTSCQIGMTELVTVREATDDSWRTHEVRSGTMERKPVHAADAR
jgi:hypothetical protein